ncbi:MAG: FecR domain-containing protein [Muribaculaceae bacterium]|nr:FecR domain-containing protein [Muribaculaceae bacterium]MDE6769844.1 FecR domain-containing protein [Muribaculaceae bacterium]
MDNRFKRFMDDEFSLSDLERLRNDVDNMTDEELSSKLDEINEEDEFSTTDVDAIQHRLNDEIIRSNRRIKIRRIAYMAASIIVGMLLGSGFYIHDLLKTNRMYADILSHEVVIGTQQGEKTTTLLPDGSKIIMSPMSSLAYKMATFNHMTREISFYGEASFSIAKNAKVPFTVHSQDFEIKVLGTVFSVLSRDNDNIIEVHLDEGSVELKTTKTKVTRVLKEGETAVLNRESGNLRIYTPTDGYRYTAGKAVALFTSEKLEKVFDTLTIYYGKNFKLHTHLSQKTFTGSLPTDNLAQALYVLEQTLNLKITADGDVYVVNY